MKNVAKKISLVAFLLAAMSVHAVAQTTPPAATQPNSPQATQTVCQSKSTTYTINPDFADEYDWKVVNGTQGTNYNYTASTTNTFTVNWLTEGNFDLMSQATKDGCKGPWSVVAVTVAPAPKMDNGSSTLCSFVTTEQEDVLNYELPTTYTSDAGTNVTITKWVVKVEVPAGVTRYGVSIAAEGTEITDKAALANDYFVNSNTTSADVVYTITPYADQCEGVAATYTVTVKPAVAAPSISW